MKGNLKRVYKRNAPPSQWLTTIKHDRFHSEMCDDWKYPDSRDYVTRCRELALQNYGHQKLHGNIRHFASRIEKTAQIETSLENHRLTVCRSPWIQKRERLF
ncbi:MAG: hypothetical protein HGB01_11160 [Chlorobiaceae bacterium]|nr:hypothetical protein [Chlorobiaceae bacterium]